MSGKEKSGTDEKEKQKSNQASTQTSSPNAVDST